jgi:hypothetical protein
MKNRKWQVSTYSTDRQLSRTDLLKMFHGEVAGIRIPRFLTVEQCKVVVERLGKPAKRRSRRYKGNLNIGTVLDIPSHWEFTYQIEDDKAWLPYFNKVGSTTRLRRSLFEGIGDPVDRVVEIFAKAWGAPVRRMSKSGKKLYAGIIRSGAPRLHFDWAPYDLSDYEVVMQAGVNVYLANGKKGGDLRVFRKYGMMKGHPASSGEKIVGNYDLPHTTLFQLVG